MGVAAAVASVALMAYVLRGQLGFGGPAALSRERAFICAATGKPFEYELKLGDFIPVASPHSGAQTGYPAERCYWTADGGTKEEPTLVLLNQYAGKSGATFCPDCRRLVVGHNPVHEAGREAPPTQETYARARKDTRNER